MLVVDSGVWIDFFADEQQPVVGLLAHLLERGEVRIVVPDLVLFEVLRGFREEGPHRPARRLMESMSVEDTGGAALAHAASGHYRALRAQGIAVRSSIDVLLAAYCIERDYSLLHRDRDFDSFESLRGLRGWRH